MSSANRRRNEALHAQLRHVATILRDVDVLPVLLKGACEFEAASYALPMTRVISDLDLLLEREASAGALAALGADGWIAGEVNAVDTRRRHCLQVLTHPDWPAPLDLHLEIGPTALAAVLPAREILDRAVAVGDLGLRVPDPVHRLLHLLLHGLLGEARFREQTVQLRDVVNLYELAPMLGPEEWQAARKRLDAHGHALALDGAAAFTDMLLPGRMPEVDDAARSWATAAFRSLGNPRRFRWAGHLRWLRWYVGNLLFDRERRHHYLARMRMPGTLARLVRFHRERHRRIR
jgi:hypothetical protein